MPRHPNQRRRHVRRLPLELLHLRRESGHGGRLEEGAQGKLHAEPRLEARDELEAQQRMAAQREEAVVGSHPVDPEQVSPDRGEPPLQIGARLLVGRVDPGPDMTGSSQEPRSMRSSCPEARRGHRAWAGPGGRPPPGSRAPPARRPRPGPLLPAGRPREPRAAAPRGRAQSPSRFPFRSNTAAARTDTPAAAPGGGARRRETRTSRSPLRRARGGPGSPTGIAGPAAGRARGAARRGRRGPPHRQPEPAGGPGCPGSGPAPSRAAPALAHATARRRRRRSGRARRDGPPSSPGPWPGRA